jgi:hypothetical protein
VIELCEHVHVCVLEGYLRHVHISSSFQNRELNMLNMFLFIIVDASCAANCGRLYDISFLLKQILLAW